MLWFDKLFIQEAKPALGRHSGSSGGSAGAEPNISYGGDTPTDTSKLWVKTDKPVTVDVSTELTYAEVTQVLEQVLPELHRLAGCVGVGKKIYLLGGYDGSNGTDTIFCLDTVTEELQLLDVTLPYTCYALSCAAIGSKIYVFGGGNRYTNACCFDTDTETITTLPSISTYTSNRGSAVVDGKTYVFGGLKEGSTGYDPNVYRVDIDGDVITQTKVGSYGGHSAYGQAGCSIGAKVYIIGGHTNGAGNLNTILCFDTETGTATTCPKTIPTKMYNVGCVSIGTNIYLFGGYTGSKSVNTIIKYDTVNETLETLTTQLSSSMNAMGCVPVDKHVYILGGAVEINLFFDGPLVPENVLKVIPQPETSEFSIINSDSIKVGVGVQKVYLGNKHGYGEEVEAALYKDGEWTTI